MKKAFQLVVIVAVLISAISFESATVQANNNGWLKCWVLPRTIPGYPYKCMWCWIHGKSIRCEPLVDYKNCTELNKKYKGGFARTGAKNKGAKTKFKPFVSNALYEVNKSKDRDKDGIACEK